MTDSKSHPDATLATSHRHRIDVRTHQRRTMQDNQRELIMRRLLDSEYSDQETCKISFNPTATLLGVGC
jgi:hypothetical protein